MALIQCLDCKHLVSETARSCPFCARPIQAMTIERTGKGWKGAMLGFGLGIPIALIMVVFGFASRQPIFFVGGISIFLTAIIGLIISRIGAWWCHG